MVQEILRQNRGSAASLPCGCPMPGCFGGRCRDENVIPCTTSALTAMQEHQARSGLGLSASGCVQAYGGSGREVQALGTAIDRHGNALISEAQQVIWQAPRLVAEQPGRGGTQGSVGDGVIG